MIRHLSTILSMCVLVLMWLESTRRASPADAAPFHAAAAEAVAAVPRVLGRWTGTDIPVPAAAQKLLRPNALLSRSYVNPESGEGFSLALVQCRDTRDMSGHYPPICYPGQGWAMVGQGVEVPVRIGDQDAAVMRYEFTRSSFEGDRTLVIFNVFAVPGHGYPKDMTQIRELAADYTARPFGAAQIQLAFSRGRPADQEAAALQDILGDLAPVLRLLSDPAWRKP